MATKLEIYNMALSAARGQGTLTSLTQSTRGREECDKWFGLVVDVSQEAAYWPCCKTRIDLDDAVKETDYEFQYSYGLPADFLRPWYLHTYGRFALMSKFDEEVGTHVTRLFTDEKDAKLYFARRVIDTARWPAAMTQAIVYGLGYKVSESLTGKAELVERLLALANGYLQQAQSISLNYEEDQKVPDSDPDWIAARESGVRMLDRYYYPFGDFWTNAP